MMGTLRFPAISFGLIFVAAACKPPLAVSPTAVQKPSFKYVKQKEGGCADVFLYKGTADDLEVMWVSAEKEKLKLPAKGSRAFDLATAPDGLQVAVDLWEKAPRFAAYCNDIADGTKKLATWKAKSGKVTISILEPVDPAEQKPRRYKVSVRLENVLFEDDAGHQATLDKEEIAEAVVGWYAG